jgi:hypothetical protein
MSHIVVYVDEPCPACGASAQVAHVQSYVNERLRYSQSFSCPSCGKRYEADGGDLAPHIREAFVAKHGSWRTELQEAGPDRLKVFERLTADLGFSRGEALHAMQSAPVAVFVGTLPEADRWRDALVAAGAQARCVEAGRG